MDLQQRKIRTPDLTSVSHWPEKPYRWMLDGLVRVIEKVGGADANYLVALGLICYTEVVGREVRKFKKLPFDSRHNQECFNTFLGEYMGYQDLLNKHPDLYKWYRHGLCHEFMIKNVGGRESGIFHFFDINDNEREVLKNDFGVDPTKGIVIGSNGKRLLLIEFYLHDFKNGIEKFLKESQQIT